MRQSTSRNRVDIVVDRPRVPRSSRYLGHLYYSQNLFRSYWQYPYSSALGHRLTVIFTEACLFKASSLFTLVENLIRSLVHCNLSRTLIIAISNWFEQPFGAQQGTLFRIDADDFPTLSRELGLNASRRSQVIVIALD